MNEQLVARYQPYDAFTGAAGDIYVTLSKKYGKDAADTVSLAALSADRGKVSDAIELISHGKPLETSTAKLLTTALTTDPLAAPLEAANKAASNSFLALLKAPSVIAVLVIVGFSLMGGWQWLGKKLFAKPA